MSTPPHSADPSTALTPPRTARSTSPLTSPVKQNKKKLLFSPREGAAGGVTVGACLGSGGEEANAGEAECKGDTLARREVWERHRSG